MKIFLSYGHDRNEPLVSRIGRDLAAAGHTVWIDAAEIKAGDHWRRAIVDGLSDTDWTLGFLSKHSTRDPGVCLDELAIALHVRGGTIATVLVEPASEVAPPISLSHVQWLDMHDWSARETAGGPEWERWYQAKMAEILGLLADPATQYFAGEIEEMERLLKPIRQEADIGVLVDGFVGRAWLRDRLDNWRKTAQDSRLFWLTGAPGTGKSAFAAWLAHSGRVNVLGFNLCRYNAEDRRDPGRVLRTLAFQIATRLPDYRRLLLDRLKRHDPDGTDLARKSPGALFDWLLTEPLRYGIDGGRSDDRYVVVIDALDETIRDGRSELAEVLAESVAQLPRWLALVITSRPELAIARQFAAFRPYRIEAEADENAEDLRTFARAWVNAMPRPSGAVDTLVERITAACDGNFLYLRKLRDAVDAGLLDFGVGHALPRGLVGLYERWFRRAFPDDAAYEKIVPMLEVLVASRRPVPEAWLAKLFGWSKREQSRMLEGLGSLFERRPDGIAPFHKSLRDWLVDEQAAGADFVIDADVGARRLRTCLWQDFVAWADARPFAPLDPYCCLELPAQMESAMLGDRRAMLAGAGCWPTIWQAIVDTADRLAANFAWDAALAWWRTGADVAAIADDAASDRRFFALRAAGDILRTLGRRDRASEAYRAALVEATRLHTDHAESPIARRALFIAQIRIGNVLISDGDTSGALAAYGQANRLSRKLVAAEPANRDWQRDLYVSLERLGDSHAARGDLARALEAMEEAATIIRAIAAVEPTDNRRKHDIAVCVGKIADLRMDNGDVASALAGYRESLALMRSLCAEEPQKIAWQRDVFAHLVRIGDVVLMQADMAAAADAYGEALRTSRSLSREDAANVEWRRDVLLSHIKQSDLLRAQGDLAGALAASQESLSIIRRLTAVDPENVEWQRDLLLCLMKRGDILEAQQDVAQAIASFAAFRTRSANGRAGSTHPSDRCRASVVEAGTTGCRLGTALGRGARHCY